MRAVDADLGNSEQLVSYYVYYTKSLQRALCENSLFENENLRTYASSSRDTFLMKSPVCSQKSADTSASLIAAAAAERVVADVAEDSCCAPFDAFDTIQANMSSTSAQLPSWAPTPLPPPPPPSPLPPPFVVHALPRV